MSPRWICCRPVVATPSPAAGGFIPKLPLRARPAPPRRAAGGRGAAALGRLLAGGGGEVAGGERLHSEAALQRLSRAVEPEILLGGREDDALGRLRLDLAEGDEIARADLGIGALEAVEADDVQHLVLRIGADRPGRGGGPGGGRGPA